MLPMVLLAGWYFWLHAVAVLWRYLAWEHDAKLLLDFKMLAVRLESAWKVAVVMFCALWAGRLTPALVCGLVLCSC